MLPTTLLCALLLLLLPPPLAGASAGSAHGAQLNMTRTFGDNMVLDFRDPGVHGFAAPGAAVTVEFAGANASSVADASTGAWRVALGAAACAEMPASEELTVTSGGTTASARNVACGQLFICTGQSNMELTLEYVNNGTAEIADTPNHPNLRLFAVGHRSSPAPQVSMGDTVILLRIL
jgi:sialate O-acetylesterase